MNRATQFAQDYDVRRRIRKCYYHRQTKRGRYQVISLRVRSISWPTVHGGPGRVQAATVDCNNPVRKLGWEPRRNRAGGVATRTHAHVMAGGRINGW